MTADPSVRRPSSPQPTPPQSSVRRSSSPQPTPPRSSVRRSSSPPSSCRRPSSPWHAPLRARLDDEEGVALITVLGLTFVVTLLLVAAVGYALNTMPQVRDHEDWNAALGAAEAGIDDALFRLNQNSSYWAVEDLDNLAMTGWREVPGASTGARYHYRLDASEVASTGAVDVTATGLVGDQTRTIEVRLRRRGFLDYLYFTDFEVVDPYAWPQLDLEVKAAMDSFCGVHWPDRDGREGPVNNDVGNLGCQQIRFVPGDVLRGPVHTNDAIRIEVAGGGPSGEAPGRPRYYGEVTTGWDGPNPGAADNQLWLRQPSSVAGATPYFQDGIRYRERLGVPQTNQRLADQAADTGCVYQGPTLIRFFTAAGAGRMSVASPLTPANSAGPGCGPGTNLDLPDGEAIYVRRSLQPVGGGHPLGLPRSNDISNYATRNGDAFVFGQVRGQVTVGAEHDVYVVHDLTYTDRSPNSADLTGLIATNNIFIYRPARSNNAALAVTGNVPPFNRLSDNPFSAQATWESPRVDAALLALNRSISVQNFNRGPGQGDLSVFGAMGQRFRGPVGQGTPGTTSFRGFLKDYEYDPRLQFLSPPHFVEPEQSPWERRRWSELTRPTVCADGIELGVDGCVPAFGAAGG